MLFLKSFSLYQFGFEYIPQTINTFINGFQRRCDADMWPSSFFTAYKLHSGDFNMCNVLPPRANKTSPPNP